MVETEEVREYDEPPRLHDNSTLLSCAAPDTRSGDRLREQSWGRNKFLICRLIITSRVALRTQTLARLRMRREVPPVCGEPCGLGSCRSRPRDSGIRDVHIMGG